MDQFGIRAFCPIPRTLIELVRERAHSNRDRHALDAEIGKFIFPVEPCSGKRRVRQPGDRNVIEDIVS